MAGEEWEHEISSLADVGTRVKDGISSASAECKNSPEKNISKTSWPYLRLRKCLRVLGLWSWRSRCASQVCRQGPGMWWSVQII